MVTAEQLKSYFGTVKDVASGVADSVTAAAGVFGDIKQQSIDAGLKLRAINADVEKTRIAAIAAKDQANARVTGQAPVSVLLGNSGPGNIPNWVYAVAAIGVVYLIVSK